MHTAAASTRRTRARSYVYKRIKVHTQDGKLSTVSLDPDLYRVIESKVGADKVITVARNVARRYNPTRIKAKRSAYVVQQLRSAFGVGGQAQSSPKSSNSKHVYAKLRVHDAQGNLTTVSLPPTFMRSARRSLSNEQISAIADKAAAAYDPTAIFTRSEHIKRALRMRLGQKVPTELQLFKRKFHLTNKRLAQMLHVSPSEVQRWEEHGEIESGPARMLIRMLWKKELSLSAVIKTTRPD